MNKKKIEKMLPEALETLKDSECGICKDGKINRSYRSAIASFGAAVTMGSFRAAVAFFSKDAEKGDSGISRSKLICAIDYLCQTYNPEWQKERGQNDANDGQNAANDGQNAANDRQNAAKWHAAKDVCAYVMKQDNEKLKLLEQDYLHAAVALKLAMNAFDLISEKKGKDESNEELTNEESEPVVQ